MRVYYFSSHESCYYVRCMLPLQHNGWKGDWETLQGEYRSPNEKTKLALMADVIVFQRPVQDEHYKAALLFKQMGKKIVMDNDDTYAEYNGVPIPENDTKEKYIKAVETFDARLKRFAEIADAITVTTDFLKKEYEQHNKNVFVLPNTVNPIDWYFPPRNPSQKVRIALVGSVTQNLDYQHIIPLLTVLQKRDDVQLVLFGLPQKGKERNLARKINEEEINFWSQFDNIEWQPLVNMKDYPRTLHELNIDIALIPRYDNYFNRCKSNLKFLEMSMVGTACIAQSFDDGQSPYQQNPDDQNYLILANTEQEWLDKTLELINNKNKIYKIAERAKEYVLREYNIETKAHLWHNVYQTL